MEKIKNEKTAQHLDLGQEIIGSLYPFKLNRFRIFNLITIINVLE